MLKEYIEKQLVHTREELNELQMKRDQLLAELKEIRQKEQKEERNIENEIFSPRIIRKHNGDKTAEVQKKIQTIEEEIERVQGLLHQSQIREKEYLNILEEIGTRETSNQTDENIRERIKEEDESIHRKIEEKDKNIHGQIEEADENTREQIEEADENIHKRKEETDENINGQIEEETGENICEQIKIETDENIHKWIEGTDQNIREQIEEADENIHKRKEKIDENIHGQIEEETGKNIREQIKIETDENIHKWIEGTDQNIREQIEEADVNIHKRKEKIDKNIHGQTKEEANKDIREQIRIEADENIYKQLDGQRVEGIETIASLQEKYAKDGDEVKRIGYSKKKEEKEDADGNKDTIRYEKNRREGLKPENSETSIAVETGKTKAKETETEAGEAKTETEIETIETKESEMEGKIEKSAGKDEQGEKENRRTKTYENLNQNEDKKEDTNENININRNRNTNGNINGNINGNGDEKNGKNLSEDFFGKTRKTGEMSPEIEDAKTLDLRKTLMAGLENNILRQVKEDAVIQVNEDTNVEPQSFLNGNEEIKSEEVIILERERKKEVEFLAKVYKKLEISLALLNDKNKCKNELREAKRMIQNYVKSLG